MGPRLLVSPTWLLLFLAIVSVPALATKTPSRSDQPIERANVASGEKDPELPSRWRAASPREDPVAAEDDGEGQKPKPPHVLTSPKAGKEDAGTAPSSIQDQPTPLQIPEDDDEVTEDSNMDDDADDERDDQPMDDCAEDRMGVDPAGALSSGGAWDDAIHHSIGIRCYHCGDVDGNGNVVKPCPPIQGSIKDWVHKNKIRTYICPTGCLTVKDPKSTKVAMMCYHVGIRKFGRRVLMDEKRKADMSRCYYAGCNAETLEEFLGRSSAGKANQTPFLFGLISTLTLLASANNWLILS